MRVKVFNLVTINLSAKYRLLPVSAS